MRFISLRILFIVAACIVLASGAAAYLYKNAEYYLWPNLIPPASYFVDQSRPLSEQTIDVELAGRLFRIPQAYIDSKLPLSGKIERSVVLTYLLPDYSPRDQFRTEKELMAAFQGRRFGHMLIEDSKKSKQVSFDEMVRNRRDNRPKIQQLGKIYGLKAERRFSTKIQSTNIEPEYDMYIETDGATKDILSFIDCRPPDTVPNPGCNHRFRDKGILYDIYYSIDHLPSWKIQRDSAINFIDGMEIDNNVGGTLP